MVLLYALNNWSWQLSENALSFDRTNVCCRLICLGNNMSKSSLEKDIPSLVISSGAERCNQGGEDTPLIRSWWYGRASTVYYGWSTCQHNGCVAWSFQNTGLLGFACCAGKPQKSFVGRRRQPMSLWREKWVLGGSWSSPVHAGCSSIICSLMCVRGRESEGGRLIGRKREWERERERKN